MREKSVIIIGAGIAGLSAGCYAAMNGYHAHIYEMHDSPGGLCTAWKRGGYTIDGCINWLVGSKPGSELHRVWEELGAVQGRQFIYPDEFLRYESIDGAVFSLYTNLERLEEHMLELSPEDTAATRRFCCAAREFARASIPVTDLTPFVTWNRKPMSEILAEFKSPLIRKAMAHAWPESFPAGFLLSTLAWLNEKDAGYPLGGSLEFSRAIERRYLALGGELFYKSKVVKILVRDDAAVGVGLEDGSERHADAVISAADGHATIFDWLGGRYVDDTIKGFYEKLKPFPSLVLVGLGVNRRFDDVPVLLSSLHFELPEPLQVADHTSHSLSVRILNIDPAQAPEDRTTLLCAFPSNYDWWVDLRQDASRYWPVKKDIARRVIGAVDHRFPGLASQVEISDVATPLTFVRYTGNWRGSFEGWMTTPETWMIQIPKTLPGLRNFWMCGQWIEQGGGLPPAALSGRNAVQLLCAHDGRQFVATTP